MMRGVRGQQTSYKTLVSYIHVVELPASFHLPPHTQTEFVCGKDHTQEVAEIEKRIIAAANLPVRLHSTIARIFSPIWFYCYQ